MAWYSVTVAFYKLEERGVVSSNHGYLFLADKNYIILTE